MTAEKICMRIIVGETKLKIVIAYPPTTQRPEKNAKFLMQSGEHQGSMHII